MWFKKKDPIDIETQVKHSGPFPVALIDLFDGKYKLNLNSICKQANKNQKLFKFAIVKPDEKDLLGKYDDDHGYTDNRCFNIINEVVNVKNRGYSYGIGITSHSIEKDAFDRHDCQMGVGIISMKNADDYNPRGTSLEKYAIYLMLCEAFCIVGRQDYEHKEVRSCLFDKCTVKNELTKCIRMSQICDECKDEIIASSEFNASDIIEAENLLKYIRKRSLRYGISKGLSHPFAGFIMGGLIFNSLFRFVEEYFDISSSQYTLFIIIQILIIIITVMLIGFGIGLKKR